MGKLEKWTLSVRAILMLAAAAFLAPALWLKPWSIDHFDGRIFATFALRHPR